MSIRSARAPHACGACYSRKIKCDWTGDTPCTNCHRERRRCKSRARRQKTQTGIPRTFHWRNFTAESPSGRVPASNAAAPADDEFIMPETGRLDPTTTTVDSCTLHRGSARNNEAGKSHTAPNAQVQQPSLSYARGYMERFAYISPETAGEADGVDIDYATNHPISPLTRGVLEMLKALELPPRAVRDSLISSFWTYCYPWMPIIERSQVLGPNVDKRSPLLLQSIFLAGSRMSPAAPSYATSHEYYQRAKTLFWLNHEPDPLTVCIATSFLVWYNQSGPEHVSVDNASFWTRVSLSLAQQMGLHIARRPVADESLRRRLWWSIVCRDQLIALAHGRPAATNLHETDVPQPTLQDFTSAPGVGHVFISYMELCLLAGRLTRDVIRKDSDAPIHVSDFENALFRLIQSFPSELRDSSFAYPASPSSNTYNFETRQLLVLYLVILILLDRAQARSPSPRFPSVAVLAASFIASIFEDFLARGQVKHLGAIFTFYCLTASLSLLLCRNSPLAVWGIAQQDLATLHQAQLELQSVWPAARGSLQTFERVAKMRSQQQPQPREEAAGESDLPVLEVRPEQIAFLQPFDKALCRLWPFSTQPAASVEGSNVFDVYDSTHNVGLGSSSNVLPESFLPSVQPYAAGAELDAIFAFDDTLASFDEAQLNWFLWEELDCEYGNA